LSGTPILRADRAPVAIEHVRPGDALLAFTPEGAVVSTTVRNVLIHDVDEYVVVVTERLTVRVTVEHPFYIGEGTFRPVAALRVGDRLYTLDGDGLCPQRIVHLERVRGLVQVYNLQTDAPHTFFAGGVAVHNKGGKGGAGGKAGRGSKAGKEGHRLDNPNKQLLPDDAEETPEDSADDEEAEESPVWLWPTLAGASVLGAGLLVGVGLLAQRWYRRRRVLAKPAVAQPALVTAGVGADVAAGVQRHVAATVLPDRVVSIQLDSLPRPAAVLARAQQTQQLLQALAQHDPIMDSADLGTVARSLFILLQYYWQEYDFASMKALVTPDLYAKHQALLEEKARNGESYRIDHLRVNAVDIVQVRYVPRLLERAFTAFITATAQNYHVGPRPAGAPGEVPRLHGDRGPVGFQEFWTFQRQGNAWLLCALEPGWKLEPLELDDVIEIPALVPALPPKVDGAPLAPEERNGAVRDTAMAVAGAHPATETIEQAPAIPAVPHVLEEAPATQPLPQVPEGAPAIRSERRLDELAPTWDPARLKERARQVFLDVLRAREAGDLTAVKDEDLYPNVAAAVLEVIDQDRQEGVATEYRHLDVQRVELIAVRPVSDSAEGLFTVRIEAQVQNIVRRHGEVVVEDPEASPFEQFWMFGRREGRWRLKGVLMPEQGRQLLAQEETSANGPERRDEAEHQGWSPHGEPGSANGGTGHDERVASSSAE
jgi:predicted lipid-binding transport protein (Tim44 family)